MKRFIDLRGQDTGYRFAFWCTFKDRFESHSDEQAWDTFTDFEEVYEGDELERFRGLTPEWAFLEPESE